MAEVLIIGSKGTLGAYLSQALCDHFIIHRFDKRFNRENNHLDELTNIISKRSIETIINCVGATDVQRCERDNEYAYNGNIIIPKVVSKIIKRSRGSVHVINFSSDQVYPGSGNAREGDAMPINEYGRSKLMGEQFLTSQTCNLRINYVSKGVNRVSFSDWVVNSAKKREHVTIFNDIYFNPVDLQTLEDCVKFILKKKIKGTFNLGSMSKLHKADFYVILTRMLGIENPNVKVSSYSCINEISKPLDMSMNIEHSLNHGFYLPSLDNVLKNIVREYQDAD